MNEGNEEAISKIKEFQVEIIKSSDHFVNDQNGFLTVLGKCEDLVVKERGATKYSDMEKVNEIPNRLRESVFTAIQPSLDTVGEGIVNDSTQMLENFATKLYRNDFYDSQEPVMQKRVSAISDHIFNNQSIIDMLLADSSELDHDRILLFMLTIIAPLLEQEVAGNLLSSINQEGPFLKFLEFYKNVISSYNNNNNKPLIGIVEKEFILSYNMVENRSNQPIEEVILIFSLELYEELVQITGTNNTPK